MDIYRLVCERLRCVWVYRSAFGFAGRRELKHPSSAVNTGEIIFYFLGASTAQSSSAVGSGVPTLAPKSPCSEAHVRVEELLRVRPRPVSDPRATEHPRDLLNALLMRQRADHRARPVPLDLLTDEQVLVTNSRDLWGVGDAEDLPRTGDVPQLKPDRLSGGAPYAAVHLIEDIDAHGVEVSDDALDREGDP